MDVRLLTLTVLLAGCPDPPEPCTPQPVTRGPWAVGWYMTEAEIRWETASDGCGGVRFGLVNSQQWLAQVASQATQIERTLEVDSDPILAPDRPGPSYVHRLALRNLTPNTCYRFQVAQPVEQVEGRFCTAASSTDADVTMAVLGNSAADDEVTTTLTQAIRAAEPHAILHLGNLQRYSDPNETWSAWFHRWRPLLNTAQILPVVGESEFERPASQADDNADTAREYAEYFAPLWRGHSHPQLGDNYAIRVGALVYIFVDTLGQVGPSIWSDQGQAWLEQILRDAEAAPGHGFSVLLMHQPAYTRSSRRRGLARREQLRTMLSGHKVPLVLAGQASCYERFEVDGRLFVNSGGAGAALEACDQSHPDPSIDGELTSLQGDHRSVHHWIRLRQSAAGLVGAVVADHNEIIDQWEIRP